MWWAEGERAERAERAGHLLKRHLNIESLAIIKHAAHTGHYGSPV